jgi:hypothetical protein
LEKSYVTLKISFLYKIARKFFTFVLYNPVTFVQANKVSLDMNSDNVVPLRYFEFLYVGVKARMSDSSGRRFFSRI